MSCVALVALGVLLFGGVCPGLSQPVRDNGPNPGPVFFEPGPACRLDITRLSSGNDFVRFRVTARATNLSDPEQSLHVRVEVPPEATITEGILEWSGEQSHTIRVELLHTEGGVMVDVFASVVSPSRPAWVRSESIEVGRYFCPAAGETFTSAELSNERPLPDLNNGPPGMIPVNITGSVTYEDRDFDLNGFTGFSELPVRFANVQVMESLGGDPGDDLVIGSGSTDSAGLFSIPINLVLATDIYVRCVTDSLLASSNSSQISRVRVREQARNAVYAVSSPIFLGVDTDLDVGKFMAPRLNVPGENRLGNPFNVFDQGIASVLYLTGSILNETKPYWDLVMHWPHPNLQSQTLGRTVFVGRDDGYDDTVILHEIAAIVLNEYSDGDSPGGAHGFGETDQDPRLSVVQGFATYFSGVVRKAEGYENPGIYVATDGVGSFDGRGTSAQVQLHCQFEDAYPFEGSVGDASEVGIFGCLWDLADNEDTLDHLPGVDDDLFDSNLDFGSSNSERALWEAMIDPFSVALDATMADVWDGWHTPTDQGAHVEIRSVFESWSMNYFEDEAEPNNDGSIPTPLIADGSSSMPFTLFSNPDKEPAPGSGDRDFFSFSVSGRALLTVQTGYVDGVLQSMVDPFLTVFDRDGVTALSATNGGGVGRNARLTVQTEGPGTYFAEVKAASGFRRYGHYEVSVLEVPNNTPPTVLLSLDTDSRVTIDVIEQDGLRDLDKLSFSVTANGTEVLPILRRNRLFTIVFRTPTQAQVLIDVPIPSGLEICASILDVSGARGSDCKLVP